MNEPPNRLAAKIALPALAPPDKRVRIRRSEMPAAPVLIAPARGQLRRSVPVPRHGGEQWRIPVKGDAVEPLAAARGQCQVCPPCPHTLWQDLGACAAGHGGYTATG
ncbi:MAG: hypothetical protein ACLQU3_17640 [Limisphaerales bacterium]